jgi:phage gp36-like protein
MAYIVQADIEMLLPQKHLVDALDDDKDGSIDPDAVAKLIAASDQAVDAFLSSRYPTPLDNPPALVKQASAIFACEMCASRRGSFGDANPFWKRAESIRTRLEKIGNGEAPLVPGQAPAFQPGAVITDDSKVTGTML